MSVESFNNLAGQFGGGGSFATFPGVQKYSEDQSRDDHGRFAGGEGGGAENFAAGMEATRQAEESHGIKPGDKVKDRQGKTERVLDVRGTTLVVGNGNDYLHVDHVSHVNGKQFDWSKKAATADLQKGDVPGHEFHGNQHTEGAGGGGSTRGWQKEAEKYGYQRMGSGVSVRSEAGTAHMLSERDGKIVHSQTGHAGETTLASRQEMKQHLDLVHEGNKDPNRDNPTGHSKEREAARVGHDVATHHNYKYQGSAQDPQNKDGRVAIYRHKDGSSLLVNEQGGWHHDATANGNGRLNGHDAGRLDERLNEAHGSKMYYRQK